MKQSKCDNIPRTFSALTLFAALTGVFSPAYGNEANSPLLEEVMVTARKLAEAESLQSLPVSASVFSAGKIAAINALDIKDLGRLVPGARMEEQGNSPGFGVFLIRGAGVSPSVPSFDPAVGVVVDGVPFGQVGQSILDVFDMEFVEILRGPQGTLFGRNVTGGVVNARTRRPTGELGFRAEATVGSYDRRDISASLDVPLIENTLAGRLTVLKRDRDGYVKDNISGDDYGEVDTLIVRPYLKWTPTDALEISLLYEYYEQKGEPLPLVPTGDGNDDFSAGGFIPGGERDFHETWFNNPQPSAGFVDFERNRVTLEAIWGVGGGVLTSITGYADMDQVYGQDFDGTSELFLSSSATYLDQDQFSQELRFASSLSDSFDYTVGMLYFTQDVYYGEQRYAASRVNCCIRPGDPIGAGYPAVGMTDHSQWAVYAEGHYQFSDQLTLTVGARYGEEEKETQVGLVDTGVCVSDGTWDVNTRSFRCPGGYQIDDNETWDNLSPKIGLEYTINDDVLAYLSWTRAFRSGGWTYRATAQELERQRPAFYDEERVDAYELGLKSDWLDNRLRANIALWFHDFKDLQRSLFISEVLEDGSLEFAQRFANVPKSEAYGLEVEVTAELIRNGFLSGDSLVVEFNWGNIEYEYKTDVDFDGNGTAEVGDFPWQQIPDYTWNLALNYAHNGPFDGNMSWRIAYAYTDEVNATGFTTFPLSWYASRELVDASVRYTAADGRWYVALFGKNLTDENDYQFITPFGPTFGIGQPMLDKTWGLTLGVNL